MFTIVTLLSRLFIKNRHDHADPSVRRAYGILCGGIGIFLNIILFIGKFIAGTIASSVSIVADAFNNLSDAGSSVITLIGFRLSGKKPDPQHPYGHGRIEYVSGLIVAMVIIVMGFELMSSSIGRIIHPESTEFSFVSIGVLIASIIMKAYMFFYNRTTAEKIDSVAMKATATDSLTDCIATFAALISMITGKVLGWMIDGWCGAFVSLFVLYSGFNAARDTISPLLGQPPSAELVKEIEDTVMAHEGILGIHDLVVHDYGPGRMMMSLHAEVPAKSDILVMHDKIDNIEKELNEKFMCEAVVHMDPVENDDAETNLVKERVLEIVHGIDPELNMHDFRIVRGPSHTNAIFDIVVPFNFKLSDSELRSAINDKLAEAWEHPVYAVITIDRRYYM